jgi:hypothetical protein
MKEVLARLQAIEVEVLAKAGGNEGEHVGSIRITNSRDPKRLDKKRLQLFDLFEPPSQADVQAAVCSNQSESNGSSEHSDATDSEDPVDTDEEAVLHLMKVGANPGHVKEDEGTSWRTARWDDQVANIDTVFEQAEGEG